MPAIKVVNLSKTYRVGRQAVPAVHGVTLDVPDGKIVTLLGPSGCGKSTTLRCIAGLERPDEGEIFFDQRPLFSRARGVAVPPEQRNVGMVFQSYAIWPHPCPTSTRKSASRCARSCTPSNAGCTSRRST